MARVSYKKLPWSTAQPDNPAYDVSAGEITQDLLETGMVGFADSTKTIATGALAVTGSHTTVSGEGGAADDLDYITYGASPDINDRDIFMLIKGAQVITVRHNIATPPANSGKIFLIGAINKLLDANIPMFVQRRGTDFYEITPMDAVSLTGNQNLQNKNLFDNNCFIVDEGDTTKKIGFSVGGSSTGTTLNLIAAITANRSITFPDATTTLVGHDAIQTLSNKTLTQPKFADLGFIADANGNELIILDTVPSAVNEITLANAATAGDVKISTTGGDTDVSLQFVPKGAGMAYGNLETIMIAISDETTAITTGTAKVTFRMPYAFKVLKVKASLTTASTSGIPTFDINEAGTSILSTKLTIDANELTSATAATPPVISDSALADDASITIDVDVAGTGAAGAKIYIIGYATAKPA